MTELQRMNDFNTIAPATIKANRALMNFLVENDFFTSPASAKRHKVFAGGLYEHSKGVFQLLSLIGNRLSLPWMREESPFIIGMFHDLCKIDRYVEVVDSVGKVMFGEGEPKGRVVHYEYNPHVLLQEHGAKSVMLLSQFLTLTEEEMLCIRYHMGAYEKADWDGFDLAVRKYPTVMFTHLADTLESKPRAGGWECYIC